MVDGPPLRRYLVPAQTAELRELLRECRYGWGAVEVAANHHRYIRELSLEVLHDSLSSLRSQLHVWELDVTEYQLVAGILGRM